MPLLVVVLLTKFEGRAILGISKELVGAAIFAVASVTDWLDGYLARRREQVTALGQVIDPLADKLLTSAAFISLVQMGVAPAWMVAIIIGREFAVTALQKSVLRARRADSGVAARQDQDGGAGRGDSGADSRRPSLAGFPLDWSRGVVGRGDCRAGFGGRLLPPVQSVSTRAASPTSPWRASSEPGRKVG